MDKQLLCQTRNQCKVYLDAKNSHAATHLTEHPELLSYAKTILQEADIEGDNVAFETDMKKVVGSADLVETTEADDILYAKRLNRDIYTRFAKNRKPEPTTYVTLVLNETKDKEYDLYSAWIGRLVPPFPGDPRETSDSLSFWRSHALAWGSQAIQPGSETTIFPWKDKDGQRK